MDIDQKQHFIYALALIAIGASVAVWFISHINDLQRENTGLHDVNISLINENQRLRYCVPGVDGKAIIIWRNGHLYCEIHDVAKKRF